MVFPIICILPFSKNPFLLPYQFLLPYNCPFTKFIIFNQVLFSIYSAQFITQNSMSTLVSSITRKLWSPSSYTHFKRYIDYFSPQDKVFKYIQNLPPIVSTHRINILKKDLAECQDNKKILFHAGDCAEPFEHVHHEILQNKVKFFNQCKSIIQSSSPKKAVIIGRIAGQYAKPRTSEFMVHNGKKIHNYKGDNVNDVDVQNRDPQHSKLCDGYFNATVTHNYLLEHMNEMFISHEGLILPYEAALTRQHHGKYYCQSAHMLWIGERTRQLDGAHIEFFRGISNPVGIKISSNIDEHEFVELMKTLNPENEKGKIIVIIRMGKDKIGHKLEKLIQCKLREKLNFLFISDPMHANTYQSQQGDKLKTRSFNHIMHELTQFRQHMARYELNSGISLQATFEDVLECFGGAYPLEEDQIKSERYVTKCDPRLNWNQTTKLLYDVYHHGHEKHPHMFTHSHHSHKSQ